MPDAQERRQMIERIIGRQLITRAGERHVPVSQLNGVRPPRFRVKCLSA